MLDRKGLEPFKKMTQLLVITTDYEGRFSKFSSQGFKIFFFEKRLILLAGRDN